MTKPETVINELRRLAGKQIVIENSDRGDTDQRLTDGPQQPRSSGAAMEEKRNETPINERRPARSIPKVKSDYGSRALELIPRRGRSGCDGSATSRKVRPASLTTRCESGCAPTLPKTAEKIKFQTGGSMKYSIRIKGELHGKPEPGWFTISDDLGALYHSRSIDTLISLAAKGSEIDIQAVIAVPRGKQ